MLLAFVATLLAVTVPEDARANTTGAPIAWGEPDGGLRAGLRLFRPVPVADQATRPNRQIRVGEVVDCDVVVENVSSGTIQFTSRQVAGPCLRVLSVRDAAGRRVEVPGPVYDGPVGSVRHSLGPGDQVRLPVASCGFAPSFPIYCDARQTTWARVGPGKYRLSASPSFIGGGLRTGELELEVLPPNRADLTDRVAAALKKRTDEFALKVVAMTDQRIGLRSLRLLTYQPKGKYPDHWSTVRIDREQAKAIIRHLAEAGYLWRTVTEPYDEKRFAKPSYFLSVSLGDESEPSRVTDLAPIPLDWGPLTKRKLKDLREVLTGDAAAAMDKLLGRVKQVHAAGTTTAPGSEQPSEHKPGTLDAEGTARRAADDAAWSKPVGGLRAKIDTSRYLTRRLWMDACVTVQNLAVEPVAIDRGIIHLIDWRVIDAEGRAVAPNATINVDVPVEWRQLGHGETIGLAVSNHRSNRGGVLDLVHVVWKLEPGKYKLTGTLSGPSKTSGKPPYSRIWSGKIELPAAEFEVVAEISDEQLRAAARRVRSAHPAGGKPMWEALAALLRPGTSVRQLKMILPPARPLLRPVVTLFNGSNFYLVYLLDGQFEIEASGIALGKKPDDLVLTSPPSPWKHRIEISGSNERHRFEPPRPFDGEGLASNVLSIVVTRIGEAGGVPVHPKQSQADTALPGSRLSIEQALGRWAAFAVACEVARGWEWEYPTGLLPETSPGLEYVSGPNDPALAGKGAWRKPVTLKQASSGIEVLVNCYRGHKEPAERRDPNVPVTPFVPMTEPDYQCQSADFHALKGAAASVKTREVFVFLRGDVLFKVEASGGTAEQRRKWARSTAEAIWEFRNEEEVATIGSQEADTIGSMWRSES